MLYKFISHIATGGYGRVDKVEGEDGKLYARKTFHVDGKTKSDGFEENAKKRFIQEAMCQAEFLHRNIVPVVELFVQETPPFFIMPLAEGSLESDKRTGFISSNKFPEAIFDILSGLEELHSIEITHRDLKPSNVLRFKDENERYYYAISDFGLISIHQGSGITKLTTTTMIKGSDFYTAPEITQHLSNATAASDIYSVGCIIHDFIGGSDRYPCNEINDVSDYADILAICTRRDPGKRFRNVNILRDALATVETKPVGPDTKIEAKLFEYLKASSLNINEESISEIISYLQNPEVDKHDRLKLALNIGLDAIIEIKKLSSVLQFTMIYTELIKNGSFEFNSCDALATRLLKLMENEGINVQINAVIALLFLGTSHNRFYVERLFASKVGPDADLKLMRRLKLEFSLDADAFVDALIILCIRSNFPSQHFIPY